MKELEVKVEAKMNFIENTFSEAIVQNFCVKKIIGKNCLYNNYMEFITWIHDFCMDQRKNEKHFNNEISNIKKEIEEINSFQKDLSNKIDDKIGQS